MVVVKHIQHNKQTKKTQ